MFARRFLILLGTLFALCTAGVHAQTVTTGAATNVADITATLNGIGNANGGTLSPSFDYGTTTAYGSTGSATPYSISGASGNVAITSSISGLFPNTTYHYRLKAYDANNVYYYGADTTFTTGPPSTLPTVGGLTTYSVGPTVANLEALSISSGGSPATVTFLYGLTTAYGSSATSPSTIPTSSTGYSANVAVTGLTPNTTSHFCCQVTNGQGTSTSADATFTTTGLPVVTTLTASGVTDINATLSGSILPNGDYSTLYFDWGTTTSYGNSVSASPFSASGSSTVSVTGIPNSLLPSTTYHYRLRAVDNSESTFTGADMTFTTAAPFTLPSVGSVTAYSIAAGSATVQVDIVSSGGSPATLVFDYGTTTSYGSTTAYSPTIPTDFTIYSPYVTLSGLNPSTTYHYRARATNGQGTADSADATFTTLARPVATTNAASGIKDLQATLNGTANADGGSLNPSFDYGTSTNYGSTGIASPTYISGSSSTAVTASLTGLTPSTTYHFRLKAQDGGGTYYYGSDLTFTTSAPATPPTIGTVSSSINAASTAFLQVTNVYAGSSTTTVFFDYGPTNSYGSTVTYSSTVPTGTTASFATVELSGLAPGTLYHYRCRATNGQGTVSSSDATFTTLAASLLTTNAPTTVKDLSAMLNGTANAEGGSLTVVFNFGTTTSYGSFIFPNNESATGSSPVAFSVAETGLAPNTTYHYRLSATDNAGVTYYGADMPFTTTAPATPPTVGTISAYPTAASASLEVSSVYTGSSPTTLTFSYGPTTAYGSTVSYGSTLSVNVTYSNIAVTALGLSPNTLYHYCCTATNAQGSVSSADGTFTTLPVPVITTTGATGVADISATLNGSGNANGGNLTVHFDYGTSTSYGSTVYPSPDALTGSSTIAFSASVSVTPSTTYHYRLSAYDSASGTYYYGSDSTFTTSAPATPPSVSTGSVSPFGATWAQLDAANLTTGSSTTTLYVDYGLTASYGSTASYPFTLSIGATYSALGVQVSGLTPGTTYHFRARAVNAQGTASGTDATFTTTALPVVTTGGATSVTDLKAILNGTGNANGGSYTGAFDFGTTTAYGSSVNTSPTSVSGTSSTSVGASPPDLQPNTTYHYRLKLTDLYSNTYYGADATFTTSSPATPPTATTAAATAVSATTAQLNASGVSSGSSPAFLTFRYGLTNSYGSSLPAIDVSTNRAITSAGAVVTGLQPLTTYHFQATISNGQGSASGQDMTFTTLGPASATTNPATNIADVSATLNGSVNPAGVTSTVTFDYGPTGAYGSTIAPGSASVSGTSTVSESAALTGLQPQTTYHYRLRLNNVDGTYTGTDSTFTTASAATLPSIGSISAGAVGAGSATLYAHTVSAGGSPANLIFDYGLSTGYGLQAAWPTSIPASTTLATASYTITGLIPGTTYHYRARATNNQGTGYASDSTFTTAGIPVVATGPISSSNDISATLTGTANANGGSLTMSFDYGTTTAYGYGTSASPSSLSGSTVNNISSSIAGLVPNTVYHYRLKAVDAAGVFWYGADMSFSTAPPSSLPSVTTGSVFVTAKTAAMYAQNISAGGSPATLSWNYGLTSAYGSSLVYPQVFAAGANWNIEVGNISGLTPSTTYHYQAVIANSFGTTYGADATFTTPAISVTATTLAATAIRSNGATLNGSYAATADTSTLTFNYGLTSSYGNSIAAVPVGTSSSAVNAVLTGLTPATTYHYQLVNANPNGTVSGTDMTFTTLAVNAPVAVTGTATGSTTGSATFRGSVNAEGGTATVMIEYGLTTGYGYAVPAVPNSVTGNVDTPSSVSVTGLTSSATYHYRVDATNAQGTTYGDDATVQMEQPPIIEFAEALANSQTATLEAFISTFGSSLTNEYFEYGTTTAYGITLPIYNPGGFDFSAIAQAGGPDIWNFPNNSNPYLQPATTYHYHVVATGPGGTVYGIDQLLITHKFCTDGEA